LGKTIISITSPKHCATATIAYLVGRLSESDHRDESQKQS